MTSPVDTTVKWFSSAMLGAPVLKTQAGSLIALLDACLVNGWGVQVADSCVVLNGVCTMTFPLDHAARQECVILVEGASIAALNGEQKVTVTAPNTVKFATAAANGTPTGVITAKMAPGGWAKPFASGTTVAVYKSLSVKANGHFFRVNDAGPNEARVIGYETMTGVSTGTFLFPTSIQLNGGLYWSKGYAGGGLMVIDWTIVIDDRFVYILPSSFMGADVSYTNYKGPTFFGFGDPVNLGKGADPFSTLVFGSSAINSNMGPRMFTTESYGDMAYQPRIPAGTGTSALCLAYPMGNATDQGVGWDRVSGQLRVTDIVLKTQPDLTAWRAKLPGVSVGHQSGMEVILPWTSVLSSGVPEKKYLNMLSSTSASALTNLYLCIFDLTGPWR